MADKAEKRKALREPLRATDVLAQVGQDDADGPLAQQMDAEMLKCVAAVRERPGVKTSLTVTLSFSLDDMSRIQIGASVDVKIPRKPISPKRLFIDDDGGLHKGNPYQAALRFIDPNNPSKGE